MHSFKLEEVSACDKPAQEFATVKIMKRDDDAAKRFDAHGRGVTHNYLARLYDGEQRANPHRTSEANFAAAWRKLSAAEQDQIREEEAAVEREKQEEEAKRRKEARQMTRSDEIADMAQHGAFVVSKAMVDNGAPGLSEHEHFRVMQEDFQKNRRADETPEQCFTRQYTAPTEEGRIIREAHQMTKRMTAPVRGGAYSQLVAKAEELRKKEPTLTSEAAFTKIYVDPANRTLVQMEKVESVRSTKAWPEVGDHYREEGGIEAFRDPKRATVALRELIAEIRRESPWLTVEDAWARLARMVSAS